MSTDVRPHLASDGVPMCDDACPSYDGKRCRVLGFRPGNICEPAVSDMVATIAGLRSQVEDLGRQLAEARRIAKEATAQGPAMRKLEEISGGLLGVRDAILENLTRERDEARAENAQFRSEVEAAHRSWQSDVARLTAQVEVNAAAFNSALNERDKAREELAAYRRAAAEQLHYDMAHVVGQQTEREKQTAELVAERDALRGRVEAMQAVVDAAVARDMFGVSYCIGPAADETGERFREWLLLDAAFDDAVDAYRTQAEPVSKETP